MLLSVVVVSRSRPEVLARCLARLLPDAGSCGAEVLIVRRRPADAAIDAVRAGDGAATWLEADPAETVPRMRALGIRRSQGETVALLEDDCEVSPGWCAAALGTGEAVVGGPLEPDSYERGLDWAVFFCEYARFLPPLQGPVAALPGNNASYPRPLVAGWLDAHGDEGFLDVFAHEHWRERGVRLRGEGAMAVRIARRWSTAAVTTDPFHHGRAFAGRRLQGRRLARIVLAGGSPLLPLLKTARVVREVLGRGRWSGSLLRALPWIIVFHTSWAFGESLGYLLGPGRSADRWQ